MSEEAPPNPIPTPSDPNSSFFFNINDNLDYNTASRYFLKLSGGTVGFINSSLYQLNGANLDFSSLAGLTAGTVVASKIVVVDANKDISSFRNLTATNLTGTLQTAAQPNITSIGTLASLTATSITGTLATAAQPNITSIGTLASLTATTLNTTNLYLGGSQVLASATELNYNYGTIPGTSAPNCSLVPDAFNAISGLFNVSSTFLTGTIGTAAQPTITSTGNLTIPASLTITNGTTPLVIRNTSLVTGLDMTIQSTSTGNVDVKLVSPLSNTLLGLYSNGKRQLTLNSSSDVVNIVNHNGSTTGLQLNSTLVTATAAQLNYTTATPGTAAASKALILDGSLNITGINSLSSTTLVGTLSTAAQPSITSLGTLTAINSSGLLTTSFANATSSLVQYGTWSNSSVPITISMQLSNIGVVLGVTTNHPLRLSTNNVNRLYINEAGQINVGTSNQTTYLMQVPGTFNATTYYINGTQMTATAAELNVLAGVTAGTAAASKALVLDSSRNLTNIGKINFTSSDSTTTTGTTVNSAFGLNVLATVNTNGQYNAAAISFRNSNVDGMPHGLIQCERKTSTTGDLIFLTQSASNLSENMRILSTGGVAINAAAVAQLSVIGSASYVDGGYQRLINLQSNNVSPISFDIQINSSTSATSTNAVFLGTVTANDLRFGTNNSTRMTLDSTGRLGIGTTTPSAILSVSGTVSNTFNAGSQLYATGTSTAYTNTILGPVTVSVAATFGGPIQATSIYCTSDRRCKEEIKLLDESYCDAFYDLDVYTYKYRGSDETIPKIGYISQDLFKSGYINLLSLTPNDNLKVETDGDIEGAQMNIDYTKITALNAMMIKKLIKRIEYLESIIQK